MLSAPCLISHVRMGSQPGSPPPPPPHTHTHTLANEPMKTYESQREGGNEEKENGKKGEIKKEVVGLHATEVKKKKKSNTPPPHKKKEKKRHAQKTKREGKKKVIKKKM